MNGLMATSEVGLKPGEDSVSKSKAGVKALIGVNTSTDTAYTDICNNNVPSFGLEQQHEELCPSTLSS